MWAWANWPASARARTTASRCGGDEAEVAAGGEHARRCARGWPRGRRRPRGCRGSRPGRPAGRPTKAASESASPCTAVTRSATPRSAARRQRGEGVGAGVDDGDVVAELGERHGEAAGAATEVEDPQRAAELGLLALDEACAATPTPRRSAGPSRRRRVGPPLLVGHGGHLLCWSGSRPAGVGVARRRDCGPRVGGRWCRRRACQPSGRSCPGWSATACAAG